MRNTEQLPMLYRGALLIALVATSPVYLPLIFDTSVYWTNRPGIANPLLSVDSYRCAYAVSRIRPAGHAKSEAYGYERTCMDKAISL